MATKNSPSYRNNFSKQNVDDECNNNHEVIVVIVPFLAQGHINLMVHMSRLVASYSLPVYFVGYSVDISAAKQRIQGWNPADYPTLRFHEFVPPPFYLSNSNPTAKGKTFSEMEASAMDGAVYLRGPIAEFLEELSTKCRKVVVINDALMANAVQDLTSIPNAESYNFYVGSAFHDATLVWEVSRKVLRVPNFLWKLIGKLILPKGALIPDNLPTPQSCFPENFLKFIVDQRKSNNFSKGHLYDACRAIEGPYLDLIKMFYRALGKGNVWGIGPFNPVVTQESTRTRNLEGSISGTHPSLEWMDRHPPRSVIFVSFGTLTVLSDAQLLELAEGLERSGQRFVWVFRNFLKGADPNIGLPEGYEERIQGRGLLLRDWVPQLEILEHPATGGFLSHCGWNSCMESICRGVPIATWPIQYDQARNAVWLTDVLRIGIEIKDWDRGDEVISSRKIESVVRRLIVSLEGDELRERAKKLGNDVKRSVAYGGVARREMDSFIAQITR